MSNDFPKLLVATEFSPNSSGGGGAILRQMLKGWPVDKLFWWSCQPDMDQRFGQVVASHAVASIPSKLYPYRRWRHPKAWLMENLWVPTAVRHLEKTLAAIRPEVVWAIPHAFGIPPMAQVLPRGGTGLHVSIHDYMNIDAYSVRFGVERCQRLARQADQLYAAATTRDAICQAMVDDLRQRTNRDGVITRAGLEPEDFADLQSPPSVPLSDGIRIAYAGSIQVESVFPVFMAALRKIRAQLPAPVTLEFYGAGDYQQRAWFDPAWMTVKGNLPLPQLAAALKQCTWGFSPMDLTDADPGYNRYSLPTKFISYLAAGLPIITLGHPESSVVKMATAHEVGVCLATADVPVLADRLLTALAEPHPALKFRPAIRACAAAEFDAVKMRTRLYENLRQCAAQPKPVR